VVDNLANSSAVSLDRVAEICNLDEESRKQRLVFHNVDMCDEDAFRKVFEASPKFDACIHFAGLKVRFHEKRFVGKSLPMTLFVTQIRLLKLMEIQKISYKIYCYEYVKSSNVCSAICRQ
jgi:UDP-glucose 4-epimerase